MSFEQANKMMVDHQIIKKSVQSHRRHIKAINLNTAKGTYFFDYGNAFLLEVSRANGDVMSKNNNKLPLPIVCTRYYGTNVF